MVKIIRKTLFWLAVAFMALTIFSLTIGQILPYEFADYRMMHNFYDIIMQGFPLAVLMTLFGTLKSKNTKSQNGLLIGSTVLASLISFGIMVSLLFRIGFGSWITLSTLYQHQTEDKVIKEQLYDEGALGYGGKRVVEIKPVLKYWILPTEIDTTSLSKSEWIYINKEGDLKFP